MGCCNSTDTKKKNRPPLPKKGEQPVMTELSTGFLRLPELAADHDAAEVHLDLGLDLGSRGSGSNRPLRLPKKSPKVAIIFYSTYGHCFAMAKAASQGASQAGATVALRRIQETLPQQVLAKMHAVDAQKAFANIPLAVPGELASFDAILIVTPTRFGSLPTQVRAFLDATGQLWMTGALTSKVGGGIVSSATQHGGQETTFRALRNFFLHQGMIVTGLSFPGMMGIDEIKGGSPYGATTITGGQGERLPSAVELEGARVQGAQITGYAAKLIA